ncbi:MAG TPA: hypothetical protein VFJ74_14360 [Gemmatimonadaceae bacterium]|nr:hypothetical protein [Gemmatimonadaceae bacterium]
MKDGPKKKGADAAAVEAFEFVDAGRTFVCEVEPPRATRPERWWWFQVTPDSRGQRYAPFRAEPGDTREAVQARIVAYYDDLLFRRSQPATSNHWGRRPAAASNGASAAAAPTATAPADADVELDVPDLPDAIEDVTPPADD